MPSGCGESREIRQAADLDLPFDLDKKLTEYLAELAENLENEAEASRKPPTGRTYRARGAEQLEKLLDDLANRRKKFEQKAMEPLEHLEKIYPLIEDQARFVAIYQQQRHLAERLASLKGRDHEDDPQQKSRMRSLEAEQRRLREELSNLLDDIESHANRLPDDEKLDDLRVSALKFADDVRGSGASDAMSDAETGLADFSGSAGHEGAQRAADTLEQFLSKCQANGEMAGTCLRFQPGLAEALGNTIEQLLGEMGLKPGGQGDGPGGYSTRRSTLDNVGLYGKLPGLDQMSGRVAQRSGPAAAGGATESGGDPGQPGEITLPSQSRAAGTHQSRSSRSLPQSRGSVLSTHHRGGRIAMTLLHRLCVGVFCCLLLTGGGVWTVLAVDDTTSVPAGQNAVDEPIPDPKQTGGEPDGIVQVANLVYAGTKSSQCFADHFLIRAEKETAISTSRRFHAVKLSSDELYNFPLVIMTGEGDFALTDAERPTWLGISSAAGSCWPRPAARPTSGSVRSAGKWPGSSRKSSSLP